MRRAEPSMQRAEKTEYHDKLEVCARFKNGAVTPISFLWRGRKYEVKKVTFTWDHRRGRSLIRHFSVSDGASLFEIAYDSEKADWRLFNICTEL
jgi:hypothetical protein